MGNLNAQIEEGKQRLKTLEARLKVSEEVLQSRESKIEDLQQSIESNNNCWQKKLNFQSQEREQELKSIGEKVKQIVDTKDKKIEAAIERANQAEAREKELEQFIENLEKGCFGQN